jgi:hypothetical protein
MAKVEDLIDEVVDASSLAHFVSLLRRDEEVAKVGSVDDYLEQMQAFLEDSRDGYLSRYAGLPQASWAFVAHLLFAAALYE